MYKNILSVSGLLLRNYGEGLNKGVDCDEKTKMVVLAACLVHEYWFDDTGSCSGNGAAG